MGSNQSAEDRSGQICAVQQQREPERDPKVPFLHSASNFSPDQERKAGELVHSEELRYLNHHHAFSSDPRLGAIQPATPGFLGKLTCFAKRQLRKLLWKLLSDYVQQEREYFAHLVRYLNNESRYIDSRDATIFFELVRKIDIDVKRVNDRVERARDEASAMTHGTVEGLAALRQELQLLDATTRGLERLFKSFEGGTFSRPVSVANQAPASPSAGASDLSYLLLENRFRGSEQAIRDRLAQYVLIFKGSSGPVLEIGSGRGELQLLMKEAGIDSYGIDMDRAMVQRAGEQGLAVMHGDGIAHLRTLADRSLGGIIAVQVVEHLTQDQLRELFTLARTKVREGGKIICETIDPRSVAALASNYYRDPTHVWPQHPDTLGFLMTLCGLKVNEVRGLSPFPPAARMQILEPHRSMNHDLAAVLQVINDNFAKLDTLLFGNQDYCIIAEA